MKIPLILLITVLWAPSLLAVEFPLTVGHHNLPASMDDVPQDLIIFVLDSPPHNRTVFFDCLYEREISMREAWRFFIVVELNLNDDPFPDYVIRPATDPMCFAYHGPHRFMYWLVTSSDMEGQGPYELAFVGMSDSISVLESMTNGYHDLEAMEFDHTKSYFEEFKFNGTEYAPTIIITRKIQ